MTGDAPLEDGAAPRPSDLAEHGPNEIHREKAISPWAILAAQFKGVMI